MTWSALHDAVEHRDTTEVVRRARSNSDEAAEVDDHGSTPLHVAASCPHPPLAVLRALLAAHPMAATDRDRNGDTPLHVALSAPVVSADVVRTLLDACPGAASVPNGEGLMPLHVACRHCPEREEVVAMLVGEYPYALRSRIKMGAPAPRRGRTLADKRPADHFVSDASARTGRPSSDLRFRDPERTRQARDGSYPLHMALSGGAPLNVIKILAEEAPDVLRMTDKRGMVPLHVALERGASPEAAALILGADPGAAALTDRGGNTPLHAACAGGCSADAARGLIDANPSALVAVNEDGMTPLRAAEVFGRCGDDVLEVLRRCGEGGKQD